MSEYDGKTLYRERKMNANRSALILSSGCEYYCKGFIHIRESREREREEHKRARGSGPCSVHPSIPLSPCHLPGDRFELPLAAP